MMKNKKSSESTSIGNVNKAETDTGNSSTSNSVPMQDGVMQAAILTQLLSFGFTFLLSFILLLSTALYILLFTSLPRADTSHLQ